MTFGPVIKDANAAEKFTIDWALYLGTGDTISSHAWSISPGGTGDPALTGGTTGTVTVGTGGTRGYVYALTDRVVTGAGVTADRSIALRVEDL